MMRFLRALFGLCSHDQMLRVRRGTRYFVECHDCGYTTELIRRVK